MHTYDEAYKAEIVGRVKGGETPEAIGREAGAPRAATIREWVVRDGHRAERSEIIERHTKPPGPLPRSAFQAGKRIVVWGDIQAKPGIDFSYLEYLGRYTASKRPDVVVCIGVVDLL